jgi:hypothetical protein
LAQPSPAGEELSGLLNAYFGQLMTLIAGHGGEVVTFAGDGLLAVWPAIDEDLVHRRGGPDRPRLLWWRPCTTKTQATGSSGRCVLVLGPAR